MGENMFLKNLLRPYMTSAVGVVVAVVGAEIAFFIIILQVPLLVAILLGGFTVFAAWFSEFGSRP